jgi:hypothetical protein
MEYVIAASLAGSFVVVVSYGAGDPGAKLDRLLPIFSANVLHGSTFRSP